MPFSGESKRYDFVSYEGKQAIKPSDFTVSNQIKDGEEDDTDDGQFDQALNYKHHNFLLFFRSLLRQQANEKRMLVSRRVKQSTKFFAKNDVLEALLSKRLYYLLFY
ncbi:hypothetical protein [Vibrio parahaemolyticus]|uniref:hypothetical protein n=1 Tax=Vibrio parahaemolyticus TaxID=670 RepID=UPI00081325CD|nr:hypothetical protein [Vibrio parahaemolyticus]OCP93269.1 hypothetical protein AKH13_07160 [Vibrio parahaemolyticus]OCQ00636.1 hypothetical protein AKH14_02640 [Vibrio parahaemolyticus]